MTERGATRAWSPDEFEAQIRAVGAERYHDKHSFHQLLHGGKVNKGQVQAWALNRYCYQEGVLRKDAVFMSRVHDRELRREWSHRIHDSATAMARGARSATCRSRSRPARSAFCLA